MRKINSLALMLLMTAIVVLVIRMLRYQCPTPNIPKVQPVVLRRLNIVPGEHALTEGEVEYWLKEMGYEAAEDHEFKSPYIITPPIYPKKLAESPGGVARKTKLISCFKCPGFFIRGNSHNVDFQSCPYRECKFDGGKKRGQADALFVFIGFVKGKEFPARPPGQIWIHSFWEPPPIYDYPEPYKPWSSAFNWTFNYRMDADLFAPYNKLAWRDRDLLLDDDQYLAIAKSKTKTAAWMVSNCDVQSKRGQYVKTLKKYIDIDIYGQCGNLHCKDAQACEQMFNTTYKFYLAFENSFCDDYITEKFFRVFQFRTHTIPVGRGGFNYNKYLPEKAFVNAGNFPNAQKLGEYLRDLGNDPHRYAAMLKEKDKLVALSTGRFDWCDVCEKVHTDRAPKIIPDIRKWTHTNTCHPPTDLD